MSKKYKLFKDISDAVPSFEEGIFDRWIVDHELLHNVAKSRPDGDPVAISSFNAAINLCAVGYKYEFPDSNAILHKTSFKFLKKIDGSRCTVAFYFLSKTKKPLPISGASSTFWLEIFQGFKEFTPPAPAKRTEPTISKDSKKRQEAPHPKTAAKRTEPTISKDSKKRQQAPHPKTAVKRTKPSDPNPETLPTSYSKISPFELAMAELRFAWRKVYGTAQVFPSDRIAFVDRTRMVLPPPPQMIAALHRSQKGFLQMHP